MADRNKRSEIFREKSLKRVSSPDDLDKYIRSTAPSIWLLLGSVILILVGVIVWSAFGKIDSASTVGCSAEDGVVTVYIKEAEFEKLSEDSFVEINGERYEIDSVKGPAVVSGDSDGFLVQACELRSGEWYYALTCSADLPDGEYKGRVVYEKVSPITFIIN